MTTDLEAVDVVDSLKEIYSQVRGMGGLGVCVCVGGGGGLFHLVLVRVIILVG